MAVLSLASEGHCFQGSENEQGKGARGDGKTGLFASAAGTIS